MTVRLLFGKPLPRAIFRAQAASVLSWMTMFLLVAGAGLISWLVMRLFNHDKSGRKQTV